MKKTPVLIGFIKSFIFPLRPGMLLYNLICTALIAISLLSFISNEQIRVEDIKIQQEEIKSTIERYKKDPNVVRAIEYYKEKKNFSNEELAKIEPKLAISMAEKHGEKLTIDRELRLPKTPSNFLFIILLVSVILTAKNFDITAQIADGEFVAPSLLPTKYVSPFIVLKWFSVWIMIFIAFVILKLLERIFPITELVSLGTIITFFMCLGVVFVFYYPAMILTLIRTNSVLDTIKPSSWSETITEHVGVVNYIILFFFLILTSVFFYFVQHSPILENVDPSDITLVVSLFVYANFHIFSSNHYMMGFMAQNGTPEGFEGDFSGYENKKVKKVSFINEANNILKSGFPTDAINLLNNALSYSDTTTEDKIAIFEKLESIYLSQNNHDQLIETHKRALKTVMEEAPHLSSKVIPPVLALIDSEKFMPSENELFTFAKYALQENKYDIALKLTKFLINNHPNHNNIGEGYILLGRALAGKKNYKKAYQAINKVFKTLDKRHPAYFDLKSELLALKRKAQL